ncbi:MAG: glycosyl transferase [Chromatiales bacterium 21-64-14]|nr:MAG: glycosyl transferase [Chromatiales bacterium 21-64-14]HQU14879.1 glycosyltransferase family 2 protein [Gammaproteobacteria bacterium]
MPHTLSIIIPARDEAEGLERLLPALRTQHPDAEILVVDDGSADATRAVGLRHGATVISHPYGQGNGAAVKTGARVASGAVLVFMDADGQHDPNDIARLTAALEQGYDMVIGARDGASQASLWRGIGNRLYNRLASWMVGHRIDDLTSGFRAVRAAKFREFLFLLPNGFSYPTTSTMAFFRAGYALAFVPIHAGKRLGRSHIHPLRDSLRFFMIIFRVATLYSPLKLFLPISAAFFVLGLIRYSYTYALHGTFTNMSALLLIMAVLVFLIGLVSEQITMLVYQASHKDR